jgi:hypothetical protein
MCLLRLLLISTASLSACSRRVLAHRLEPLRSLLVSAASVPAEAVAEYKIPLCCCCARRTLAHRLEPLRKLLISAANIPAEAVAELSATELRDALLVLDPLNKPWVAQVNQAEAEFWKRCVKGRLIEDIKVPVALMNVHLDCVTS